MKYLFSYFVTALMTVSAFSQSDVENKISLILAEIKSIKFEHEALNQVKNDLRDSRDSTKEAWSTINYLKGAIAQKNIAIEKKDSIIESERKTSSDRNKELENFKTKQREILKNEISDLVSKKTPLINSFVIESILTRLPILDPENKVQFEDFKEIRDTLMQVNKIFEVEYDFKKINAAKNSLTRIENSIRKFPQNQALKEEVQLVRDNINNYCKVTYDLYVQLNKATTLDFNDKVATTRILDRLYYTVENLQNYDYLVETLNNFIDQPQFRIGFKNKELIKCN